MVLKGCLISIGMLLLVVLYSGVYKALYDILFSSPCIMPTRNTLALFLRKPLNCAVCVNNTKIDDVKNISAEEFEHKYAYTGRPLVVRAAAQNWKAVDSIDFDFLKTLNDVSGMIGCQFITYDDEFQSLDDVFSMDRARLQHSNNSKPWYCGWSVCDPLAVSFLRQYYRKPYFLPETSENYIVDWIFIGSTGYGANLHIDDVHLPSWQAQIKGQKRWTLQTPTECLHECQHTYEVDVSPGDIIVLDTNLWYHATKVISQDISITIGAEYD